MRTYALPHWLRFSTPRYYQGQTVVRSYGIDLQDQVVIRRTVDRSEAEESWSIADLTLDDCFRLRFYEPEGADYGPEIEGNYEPVEILEEDQD